MTAYYNEIDPYAAAWLRNLIDAGHIAPGVVDTRSITDIDPNDLTQYTQVHLFAGIGVWSYALRRAGWPDDRPVWTGSCPCQPFSSAGKQLGVNDERHLWPAFARLIAECRPATVFGEQVASRAGRDWLTSVRADLETLGYGVGAADLCAAGTGAPHIRQRLYWVADAGCTRGQRWPNASGPSQADAGQWQQGATDDQPRSGIGGLADADGGRQQERSQQHGGTQRPEQPAPQRHDAGGCGEGSGLADTDNARQQGDGLQPLQRGGAGIGEIAGTTGLGAVSGLADAHHQGLEGRSGVQERADQRPAGPRGLEGGPSAPDGIWAAPDWLWCRDGKWRPVRSGTFPLAHGVANRVGRLRAYGNAIVPQVAEAFIRAYLGDDQ